MILGKVNGPLEWMRSIIICDKVCLTVMWTSSVFSTKDCQSSLVYDTVTEQQMEFYCSLSNKQTLETEV